MVEPMLLMLARAVTLAEVKGTTELHVEPSALGINAAGWVALSMLAVIGLMLWKKVPSLVAGMLDAKIATIRTQLDEARGLRAEAEAMLADAKARSAASAGDAEAIVAHAHVEAQALLAKAETDAAELIARRGQMAEDKIGAAERARAGRGARRRRRRRGPRRRRADRRAAWRRHRPDFGRSHHRGARPTQLIAGRRRFAGAPRTRYSVGAGRRGRCVAASVPCPTVRCLLPSRSSAPSPQPSLPSTPSRVPRPRRSRSTAWSRVLPQPTLRLRRHRPRISLLRRRRSPLRRTLRLRRHRPRISLLRRRRSPLRRYLKPTPSRRPPPRCGESSPSTRRSRT